MLTYRNGGERSSLVARTLKNFESIDFARRKCGSIFEEPKLDNQSLSWIQKWLSYEGRTVDALALGADEGRDKHRYASGSCK